MNRTEFLTDPQLRPPGGRVVWRNVSDGVSIRFGFWPKADAKGTVLILAGRTEFIEKYGPAAIDFAQRGYACASIDWRGQGLSDRLLQDPSIGHVREFQDYQIDLQAFVEEAKNTGMPEPFYLIGHSMGGAIGLRALISGIDVKAAVFSAPMWGINLSPPGAPVVPVDVGEVGDDGGEGGGQPLGGGQAGGVEKVDAVVADD